MAEGMSRNEQVVRALSPLLGKTVAEARLSPLGGDWINISLGGALIWINMTAWLLESGSDFILACEDALDYIHAMIAELDGRPLTSLDVSPLLDLTLDFNGIRLITFSTSSRADIKHWSVQMTSGYTLFAGPGRSWSLEQTG